MELAFIDWLRSRLPPSQCLGIGPGDDAALVHLPGRQLIATVDMLTDGVDFDLRRDDPRRVGRKALAVNLSDLAAMAARPLAALVAVTLPRVDAATLARELYEGLLPLAEAYQVAIAGGDTNTWDGPLAISVTMLGTPSASGPVTRSGARPGDQLLVTGALGGSLLGHHFDFEPRVREALEPGGPVSTACRHRHQRRIDARFVALAAREWLRSGARLAVDSDRAGGSSRWRDNRQTGDQPSIMRSATAKILN